MPNLTLSLDAGTLRYSAGSATAARRAVLAGCDNHLTEDFNAGQVISGVEVVNPFAWTRSIVGRL